jgi:hypothetical protein
VAVQLATPATIPLSRRGRGAAIPTPLSLWERGSNDGSPLPLGEGQGVRAVGGMVGVLSLGGQLNCHPDKNATPTRTCRTLPSP